jgi:hypothetical protein
MAIAKHLVQLLSQVDLHTSKSHFCLMNVRIAALIDIAEL